MIREITEKDLDGLLTLYTQLHDNPFPKKSDELNRLWSEILSDRNHHIIVCEENGGDRFLLRMRYCPKSYSRTKTLRAYRKRYHR